MGASDDDFSRLLMKIKAGEKCRKIRKRMILNNKLRRLGTLRNAQQPVKPMNIETHPIENLVVNKLSYTFSTKEMNLLNKGLKYAITPKRTDKEDNIADVETAIRGADHGAKENIRKEVYKILRGSNNSNLDNKTRSEHATVKSLNEKPVYYIKADKGNTIVIMNKDDYDEKIIDKLNNGNFRKTRINPLKESAMKVRKALKECKFLDFNINDLTMPNPSVPKLVCLPKIHKEGEQFREIISANGAPTYKIAKWLVKRFGEMDFRSCSIKNREEFIEKTKGLKIGPDELMVSFDVQALFPSVPVKEALEYLKVWLSTQAGETENWNNKVKEYHKLARLCMEENYFEFRNEMYRTTSGVSMGNPLSPFIAELFMSKLEKRMEEDSLMPRVWMRYVDDVFAIVDKEELKNINRCINKLHRNIEFTNYIESTKHKMAAFNSMIHRMLTTPMDRHDYRSEVNFILDMGEERILEEQRTTWASLSYDHHCTNLINKQLRKHNIWTSETNS
ncbi:uncharacterized protein LOC129616456 [Condylostylus longicornis]|uniref:uncharacterized protein LOC129616456 n=1 Tax=Condylostylus longicornis TaxID=2530218 RepID=UPI00244E56CB|nr:uncharacterized protein LOC129616456 [Condylostylus longicornis]